MSDQAVNQQHLQAMGLGGVNLGEQYNQSLHDPERCDMVHDTQRCARRIGHEGPHARGALAWPQAESNGVEPTTPDYVFFLLDALVTGKPLDFCGAEVPKDVQECLAARYPGVSDD